MQRIPSIDPANAQGKAAELLGAVQKKLSKVPNIFKSLANSPAALQAYLAQSEALSQGVLPPALREQIALAIAGENGCDYCASAHTLMGKHAGLAEPELKQNLKGQSADAKTQAALKFARKIVETRGRISDSDMDAVRSAGYNDAAITEIFAHVAVNIFTNYFNIGAKIEVDFPRVDAGGGDSRSEAA